MVAGGAVAGMTTALVLAEAGASVTLLERVAEPSEVGAGILLQPNGLAVLAALSLDQRLQRHAWRPPELVVRSSDGAPILALSLPDFGPRFTHTLALRRSWLYEVLLAAVRAHPAITTHFGVEVTAAHPAGRVQCRRHGSANTLMADLVVGADGVGSTVRAHGDFGARVRATGATYVRGLVANDDLGLCDEYWTPLGLFGGLPMGDGSTYFYAGATEPSVASAIARRDLAALQQLWAQELLLAGTVLERVGSYDGLLITDVIRVDCIRWCDGRLVLVGDAAHAMAPNLGQGANSALVDAAVLAVELAADQPIEQALARYATRRRDVVRRVQDDADRLARLASLSHPGLRKLRDRALRLTDHMTRLQDKRGRLVQQEDPAWLYANLRRLIEGQT